MSKKATIAIALLALLAALLPCAFAQTVVTGDVAGVVTDPSGAVVPNVSLTIKNLANGDTKTATTGKAGEFRFPLLRPGTYTLEATASGFSKSEKQVAVDLGQVATVKIQLGVQSQTQVVEVSESLELLQSENANLATTFNQNQVSNLPNPGDDMTNFALFSPGVTVSTGGGYGNYSAFGLPGDSNLYTVNGLDMNDPFNNLNNSGSSNMMLGANEVAEAAVVLNGYTGQYGRQAGAQLNYATKTGGNAFHGNASWQYNGRVLNANDWFNNATGTDRPFDISNQWYDSIGGPIVKNKLFFFFNNEGIRYVLPGGGPVYVPTSDFAAAVLQNLKTTNPAAVPLYTTGLGVYGGSSGAGRATPLTAAQDPALGCGDLVTTNSAGKPISSLAGQFGITRPCAAVFQSTANSLNTEWLQSERVDYNINANHKIFLRFWSDRGVQATSTDAINNAFSANSNQPQDNGQVGYTASFGPRMVNQLIASAMYYSAIFGPPNLPGAFAVFPTAWIFNDGAPYTNLGGGGNQTGNSTYGYPQGRNVRERQLVDDFAISSGAHTVKFGVNARRIGWTDFGSQAGYNGQYTFNSMTDFYTGILDNGSTYSQNFVSQGASGLRSYSLGFYGQDEWKVTKKLNVTIAFRFDRNSNINCVKNCFSELTGPFTSLLHNASIPYNQVIRTNVKNAFPAIDAIVPEPRFGFAYSVDEKTVIRGGIGMFSDLYQPLIATRFEQNFPGVASFSTPGGQIVAQGNVTNGAQATVANSANALLSGFNSGATLAGLKASVPGFSPPNYNVIGSNINYPIYYEWNLEVQRALARDVTLSVNYVGNHGVDEILENAFENGYAANGFGGLPTTAPDPRFSQIRDVYSNGYSYYDGLVTSLHFRVGSEFQGGFSYTWSHALDTCSNGCLARFNLLAEAPSLAYVVSPSLKLNYSSSDYDIRHSLNANWIYSPKLNIANPFVKAVAGGWSIAGTMLYHSSYPFTVQNSGVRGKNGVQNLAGITTNTIIADWIGGGNGYPVCSTPNSQCLFQSSFQTSANQHDFGNIPRNTFRGPGYFDADLNVHKAFTYKEHYTLQIGVFLYNVLNHPNFDLPFNNVNTGVFGNILETVSAPNSPYGNFQGSSVSGRVIQTQVKFSF